MRLPSAPGLLLVACLFGITVPGSASAFGGETSGGDSGRVSGRVVDQTGDPLPGVQIDLVSRGIELTTVTDRDGRYAFETAPAGEAALTYRLLHFSVLRRIATVHPGQSATLDVRLTLSLSADVLVTARATFRNIDR